MLFDTDRVPTRRELLIDLAAFGGTVAVAVLQDWKAADLVWASWITSLLLGLAFYLVLSLRMLWDYAVAVPGGGPAPMDSRPGCLGLAVGGLMAFLAWIVGPGPARMMLIGLVGLDAVALVVSLPAARGWFGMTLRRPCVRALFYLPTALYLFFFFLMHFGGFHLGHAVFLGFFVPPEVGFTVVADQAAGFRDTLVAAREGMAAFVVGLALAYWPYLASVALRSAGVFVEVFSGGGTPKDLMILPYRNVVRVHILIFALIPLAAFESGLVMTLGVLVFFFFPVESVVARLRSR